MTRCLITGCALVIEGRDHYAWGDLHMLDRGAAFIFNAIRAADSPEGARWFDLADPIHGTPMKALTVPRGTDYFARTGVFVLPASRSLLNVAALAHVAGIIEEIPD